MLEIYFETYGCTANQNATEIMKGLVKQAGLNLTSKIDYADIIVLNTCIVKEPTEEKIRRKIRDLLKRSKKIIVAGCMPKLNKDKLQGENLFLLDTSHTKDIVNLIKDIQEGVYDEHKYLSKRNEVKADLPKISKEKFVGITQISEGCLGQCNYCVVRLAKGKLFSYPQDKILQSIKSDLENGCKEIWLTSQDTASYGNEEKKYLLPELLNEILKIKKDFKIRLGMMNPNNVLEILPELIEIYKDKKLFKFLHLPIQSGSDLVLSSMNRKYSKTEILKIIKAFRKEIPEITIATDIIVGYPGETEKDFQETIDLIKEIKPEILNPSKFWPRQKTPAAKLKQISPDTRRKRVTQVMNLHLEICKEIQKKWVGKEEKVLVDQKGFGDTYLARTKDYRLVAIKSDKNILGKKFDVKIVRAFPHYLIGEVSES